MPPPPCALQERGELATKIGSATLGVLLFQVSEPVWWVGWLVFLWVFEGCLVGAVQAAGQLLLLLLLLLRPFDPDGRPSCLARAACPRPSVCACTCCKGRSAPHRPLFHGLLAAAPPPSFPPPPPWGACVPPARARAPVLQDIAVVPFLVLLPLISNGGSAELMAVSTEY